MSNFEGLNTINISYFKTPLGELIIGSFKGVLCLCDWRYRSMRSSIDTRIQKGLNATYLLKEDAVISETKEQLTEYFLATRETFLIPLLPVGSDFQKQVWNALLQIPYGTTKSYIELSNMINNPKAIRAVAAANGANAFSILIPCHRIIGSDGSLIGYAGGVETKKKLLVLEGARIENQLRLF